MLKHLISTSIIGLFVLIAISPCVISEDTLEETHDINLYIFGDEESNSWHHPWSGGNITTKAPNSTMDENFTFHLPNSGGTEDHGFWTSSPLHKNISLIGDVHITIWAVCNQPRNISFELILQIIEPKSGGHGYGPVTETKFVYNEPVEFTAILSEGDLQENELNTFHSGDRISISIRPVYQSPQQPADVSILYNSTNHPSHMMLNPSSISIDLQNFKTSNENKDENNNGIPDVYDLPIAILILSIPVIILPTVILYLNKRSNVSEKGKKKENPPNK